MPSHPCMIITTNKRLLLKEFGFIHFLNNENCDDMSPEHLYGRI